MINKLEIMGNVGLFFFFYWWGYLVWILSLIDMILNDDGWLFVEVCLIYFNIILK